MSSLREQIVARCAVVAAAALPGVLVARSRAEALAREEGDAVFVSPASEASRTCSQYSDRHELEVDFELLVRGDPYDQLADALAVPLHAALIGDAPMAQLYDQVTKVRSAWTNRDGDATPGSLLMTYRFTYLAASRDIAAGPYP